MSFTHEQMYKYGVVRMDDLIRDILEWKRFYFSGRLQKPVSFTALMFISLFHYEIIKERIFIIKDHLFILYKVAVYMCSLLNIFF